HGPEEGDRGLQGERQQGRRAAVTVQGVAGGVGAGGCVTPRRDCVSLRGSGVGWFCAGRASLRRQRDNSGQPDSPEASRSALTTAPVTVPHVSAWSEVRVILVTPGRCGSQCRATRQP